MSMYIYVLYMYTFFHGNRVDFRKEVESTASVTSPVEYVTNRHKITGLFCKRAL